MFTLTRTLGIRKALSSEAIPLLLSLVTAEVFYKLHSFVLEAAAFLATWYCLSWAFSTLRRSKRRTA